MFLFLWSVWAFILFTNTYHSFAFTITINQRSFYSSPLPSSWKRQHPSLEKTTTSPRYFHHEYDSTGRKEEATILYSFMESSVLDVVSPTHGKSSSEKEKVIDHYAPKNNVVITPTSTTGLTVQEQKELDQLLTEALFRVAYFMESDIFAQSADNGNDGDEDDSDRPFLALQKLMHNCQTQVEIRTSTIPGAGRGLFATQDMPKGTIVSFYGIHSIGCKLESTGLCQSVQRVPGPLFGNGNGNNNDTDDKEDDNEDDDIFFDNESSEYALFSLLPQLPLCGVNLLEQYPQHQPKLFVDMNPKSISTQTLPKGWWAGLMNDAAVVQEPLDIHYYSQSRSKQNVELVPFGTVAAPFQVGVTTRHVQAGEELFVSYGYNYWANRLLSQNNHKQTKMEYTQEQEHRTILQQQEEQATRQVFQALQMVQENYAQEIQEMAELLDALGGGGGGGVDNDDHRDNDNDNDDQEETRLENNIVRWNTCGHGQLQKVEDGPSVWQSMLQPFQKDGMMRVGA